MVARGSAADSGVPTELIPAGLEALCFRFDAAVHLRLALAGAAVQDSELEPMMCTLTETAIVQA